MYSQKILNSIFQGDTSAFTAIGDREEIVFTEKHELSFYRFLYSYFLEFDKIPSESYLEDFFSLEKNNIAEKAYRELLMDATEVSEDLPALVKSQIRYNVKQQTLELNSSFSNKIKIANVSDLKDLNFDFQTKISEVNSYLEDSSHNRGALYGEEAQAKFKRKYMEKKNSDKGYYIGKTGFDTIDMAIGGIHSSDKITLLGYTNQGKSPLMRTIAYNLLIQGLNVMFVTLEMHFDSKELSFYTLHANNYKVFGLNVPKITSKAARETTLSDEAEDYLFNTVVPDFTTNENYGTLEIFQPEGEFSFDDLVMEVNRVHMTQMPVDILLIDYAVPLLKPKKNRNSFSTDDYNAMHRALRNFGLTFDRGRGLPIIDACQTNRAGFEDACSRKNTDNLYKLTAIGDYNSIERDSTHVISILQTDDMKAEGTCQLQHLKSRESSFFKHYKVHLEGATGWIRETANMDIDEEDITSAIEELEL